ncbi:GNAT family N-acetyltransferase [Geobacillus sp. Manikaran-105]|uniref:GNAT family N-acetyltransferase n=1 Tax=Geobacillus sp. Manikaran-105 TaxID=2055940 RepID=UPI000C28ED1B|nr:GNAT family N-acetyltransferase [Geobacillus sp. Manikaran-105]PJW14597.1 GNAT family N-acetyltransferase [Geobacillus sp. Manikaran-105]
MIAELRIADEKMAAMVLRLQRRAYAIEAQLIGSTALPPLHDTIASLQRCGERFFGYCQGGRLVGAIAYERSGPTLHLCRLMVDPDCFRQGIASALLAFVIKQEPSACEMVVTTGSGNTPAIRFYKRHGFQVIEERETPEGIRLTKLVKRNIKS